MVDPSGGAKILIVYAPAVIPPRQVAAFAVEVARVGAAAVRLPVADPAWLADTRTAVEAATDLVVLDPGADVLDPPLGGLAVESIVGGAEVRALLTGLAAGTHLRAGSADTPGDGSPRHDVQLVGRAAALARLSGRTPMTPVEAREFLGR